MMHTMLVIQMVKNGAVDKVKGVRFITEMEL